MAGILSDVLGGSDSENSSNDSSTLVSDLDASVGIDASNESTTTSTDDDGSSETMSNASDFGLDANTDSLLGSMNDSSSTSDTDEGGTLLG